MDRSNETPEARCRTCAGSGWYGSRKHDPEHCSPHIHCDCGATCRACPAPVQPPAPDPDQTCAHTVCSCALGAMPRCKVPAPDPDETCGSRGPRIGSEGKPVCSLPKGHDGQHASDYDATGFNETWHNSQPTPVPPATTGGTDEAEGLVTCPECRSTFGLEDHTVHDDGLHRDNLGAIIWHTSRADEGTISATGADIIAATILASSWLRERDLARDARTRAGALREAADEAYLAAGSPEATKRVTRWLRDRADREATR